MGIAGARNELTATLALNFDSDVESTVYLVNATGVK
jgi:hypothetical protein